jgi:hypothetical protein
MRVLSSAFAVGNKIKFNQLAMSAQVLHLNGGLPTSDHHLDELKIQHQINQNLLFAKHIAVSISVLKLFFAWNLACMLILCMFTN